LAVKSSEIDLWLIPGLAFSPDGIRLGRGGGYYDRLLAGTSGTKAGILYECQLMPDIPFESHDICMNILVMENKTLMIC
jgi:5-formyltetrahydrofolate cyclo-ligase